MSLSMRIAAKIWWAMRHRAGTTALALLPLVLGGHAQAAENEGKVITLSCDGTLSRIYGANKPADPEPLRTTGAVVNLNEQTVFFLGYVVPIESVDEASINFGARQAVDYGFIIGVTGHIDRGKWSHGLRGRNILLIWIAAIRSFAMAPGPLAY
jgi:hypothetical protein